MTVIQLNQGQFRVINDRTALETYLEGGWGGGKSFAIAEFMIDRSAHNPPDAMCMSATRTTPMLRTITIPALEAGFRRWGCVPRFNKAEQLFVWSPENRRIFLRTAQEPERLDGPTLTHAALDESGQCKPECHRRITSRVRDARVSVITGKLMEPQCLFGGRPEGTRTWFNRRIRRIQNGITKDAIHVRVTTFDNQRNLSRNYVKRIRDAIEGDPQAEREVLWGEASDRKGGIYGRISVDNLRPAGERPSGHIVLGADFNVGHMVWVLGAWNAKRGVLHVFGEFVTTREVVDPQRNHPFVTATGEDAFTLTHGEWVARVLCQRQLAARDGRTLVDMTRQDVTLYPDATNDHGETSSELSDHQLAHEAGFRIRTDLANPRVRDRIAAVRGALKSGHLLIDPQGAPLTLMALRGHAYDKHGDPQKDFPDGELELDHYMDALGYLVWGCIPLKRRAGRVPTRRQ